MIKARPSLTAVTGTLKMFFAKSPLADSVTADEIFANAGRDPMAVTQNKSWLKNKLTHLKSYNLATAVYTKTNPRTLIGIALTPDGKRILQDELNGGQDSKVITLESIANDIKEFRKQNPSIELEFRVSIKEEL